MRLFSRVSFLATLACVLAPATGVDHAAAGEVRAIDIRRPVSMAGAQRTYWIGAGASDEDAIALREALVVAGARNVNVFLPDMVVVCDVPPSFAQRVARAGSTSGAFAPREARTMHAASVASEPWGWIVESYALADRVARGEGASAVAPDADDPNAFSDVVLTLSPERVDAIQREVEAAISSRGMNAERPLVARKINQNSEFLGGYILANFIYAESNGVREGDTETWTDEDLRQARIGSAAAFATWQGKFPNMDISYVLQTFERVATAYEPIAHDMNSDHLWIVDCMRTLGWGQRSDDPQPVVHEFNENERSRLRTNWVVTSFIANSRNTPGNRFGNGAAPYTAYAFLGGPYMVEPFPAGGDPNNVGETLVYSQIVNHEVGHLFYTLDEYPNSPGACGDRSGYLNYKNENQTMSLPGGGEARCKPLVNCIMHSAARFDQGRPWCDWSQGHLGVLDGNGNAMPDMFEAAPEITFVPEGPETVTTNHYTLRLKAKARAVPNQNPFQGPERVDYASPLEEGRLLFGAIQVELDALDGRWDEVEEEAEFNLSIPQAGQHIVLVARVENRVGFRSQPTTKVVFFAGVRFERVIALPKWNRIDVTWQTTGETFGASYNVYRLAPGEAMPGTRIAEGPGPIETGPHGEARYQVHDFDVSAGKDYRYYVEGVFELPYDGGMREYRSKSTLVGQTAMVEVADVVSNLAPNPTRGSVTFSVSVPQSFEQTNRGPSRIPTDVDVRVYNVQGQLIRTLKQSGELNSIVTLRWDGTTQGGLQAPSGVYFLRVKAGDAEGVRKIVLLR